MRPKLQLRCDFSCACSGFQGNVPRIVCLALSKLELSQSNLAGRVEVNLVSPRGWGDMKCAPRITLFEEKSGKKVMGPWRKKTMKVDKEGKIGLGKGVGS